MFCLHFIACYQGFDTYFAAIFNTNVSLHCITYFQSITPQENSCRSINRGKNVVIKMIIASKIFLDRFQHARKTKINVENLSKTE